MRSEISGLLYHTLTADYEYFLSNRENLQLPFQIKLSKNTTTFFGTLVAFLESTLNFQFSKKKMRLIGQVFLKLLTPKDVLI